MGQQQSKDELLYQHVCSGNVDGIKSLYSEGAKLEYVDREGKTPLIAACLNPALHHVVKLLIELGANVNAYRPGRNGGTPLHHAAKRGLEYHVNLLLSHGANALLLNDDCQTALDIARAKGFTNIVRAIESHICLYAGWLREPMMPGFLELLAPQFLSRKVWAVVVPSGSRNLRKPFKLELAIYTSIQDAQPRSKIALWKASMEEPAFNQPDPAVVLCETSTISRHGRRRRCRPRRVTCNQTRIKLAPVDENDKQQLQQFCNACKGIPQVAHSNFPFNTPPIVPSVPSTAQPAKPPTDDEDLELAMAINASIQSAIEHGQSVDHFQTSDGASSSIYRESEPFLGKVNPPMEEVATVTEDRAHTPGPTPSAPVIAEENQDCPIHYPTIDSDALHVSGLMGPETNITEDERKKGKLSSCAICFDAEVEAACVPCGHMAGCMSCLNEIKAKKWGCPVCRAKIDQVIKVYSV
ncbi:hypothetical protein KSS87_010898 [Heliosperma pusillum]|nr:hypothetical protein KSS87_010898 [Heliosperma pusillum]